MNIQVLRSVLAISALLAAVAGPSHRSLAQTNPANPSASNNAATSVGIAKHRYWRHHGGRHPHYGSRRVRT